MVRETHFLRLVPVSKRGAEGRFLRVEEIFSLRRWATVPTPIRLIGLFLTGLREYCQQLSCTEKGRPIQITELLLSQLTSLRDYTINIAALPSGRITGLYRINEGYILRILWFALWSTSSLPHNLDTRSFWAGSGHKIGQYSALCTWCTFSWNFNGLKSTF